MMMRIMMVSLLLYVGFMACNTQPAGKSKDQLSLEADSLLNFLKVEVNEAFNQEPIERALFLLDSISPIINANGDPLVINNLYRFKGTYYANIDRNDSAKIFVQKALDHAVLYDSSRKQVYAAMMAMAAIFKSERNFDSALNYASEAYVYAKAHDTLIYPVTCLRLAEIYSAIGDVALNGKYLLEGFEHASNKRLRHVLANNIARYYDRLKLYDSALAFFENHVLPDTILDGPATYGDVMQNYGVLLLKKGDVKQAVAMFKHALSHYARNNAGDQDYALLFFNLADAYRKVNNYQLSNNFLDSSRARSASQISLHDLSRILDNMADNNYHLGRFRQAYLLKDSALSVYANDVDSSFVTQARELETKYQLSAKDNEIQSLNAANESVRKISALQRILLFGSAFMLVLICVVALMIYRRRGLKERLKQTELEQQLLRSQMEPHFIFNTLSTLQSLIRTDNREKSVKYLNQFARLLRLNLENSRASLVLLTREVEALQNYLSLQLMRFESIFEYQLNIYDNYQNDEAYIPPMLIQPFVENAIQYGFQNLNQKGLIQIEIEKYPEAIKCIIEDNGRGLQHHKPTEGKKSLSTEIIKERLHILGRKLGAQANLTVIDKTTAATGQGVMVILTIPYSTKPL
jgi:two-component sensor histidine kinase